MSTNQNKPLMIAIEKMGQSENEQHIVKLTKFKKMPSQTDLYKNDKNLIEASCIRDEGEVDNAFNFRLHNYGLDTGPNRESLAGSTASLKETLTCPRCRHERRMKLSDKFHCFCNCHSKGKTLLINRSSFPLDASFHTKRFERSKTLDVVRTPKNTVTEKEQTKLFFEFFKSPHKVMDLLPAMSALDVKTRKGADNTTIPIMSNSRLSSRRNSTSLTLPDLKARRKSESHSEFIRSHSARARRNSDIFAINNFNGTLPFDILPNKIKVSKASEIISAKVTSVTTSVITQITQVSYVNSEMKDYQSKPVVSSSPKMAYNVISKPLNSDYRQESPVTKSYDTTINIPCQSPKMNGPNAKSEVRLRKTCATEFDNRKSFIEANIDDPTIKDKRRLSESGMPLDLSNLLQVGEDLFESTPVKTLSLLMRHLEKGETLLQEAVTGEGDEGVRDLARALQLHLSQFTQRLHLTRDRLEDTARCYHLLDKTYEWALEAMKVVGRVKSEGLASPDQVGIAAKTLAVHLEEHPPISEDTFASMISLATRLNNQTLLQQCKMAQARCQETSNLLRSRHGALLKAKHQMEFDCQSYVDLSEVLASPDDPSPFTWFTNSPLNSSGRRRSISSIGSRPKDPLSRCASLDTDDDSVFNEPIQQQMPVKPPVEARSSLGGIKEVRESAEDLLTTEGNKDNEEQEHNSNSYSSIPNTKRCVSSTNSMSSDSSCASSDRSGSISPSNSKAFMKRSNTWQYGMMPSKLHEDNNGILNNSLTSSKSVPPSSSVNSHLMIRGSQLNISFNTEDLTQEEVKKNKTLLMIMQELIQTERDYVHSLEYIIENYIPELMREDIPQALRGQRNAIFGNIEKIFEFHSGYFLGALESCEMRPFAVGNVFLKYESQFYLYALYNKNKPKSDSLMSEYGTSFFKAMQLKLEDRMDLASYLLKPVQRMGKYALILKQLLKECSGGEEGHEELITAQEMVRFQLRHGNDLLAMDSLRDCDVNLKEQGRLLRQGEFVVWEGGKAKKTTRHLFLFEDLILFSKARKDPEKRTLDIFQYKSSMKMTDIGLTEQIGESTTKFEIWFRKRKPSDTYLLQAPSVEVKDSWTEEISKLLWRQALRNRTMRLHEMSSMGIGNKPCLDIRPSEDQINDRSISYNHFNKTPKLRSGSVTSTTDTTTTTPNRRPYSIISVASSSASSSGSSQRSSGPPTVGTLNLGFEPGDSPRALHRSVTRTSQCSAESGILADMYNGDSEDASPQHRKVERSNSTITTLSVDSAFSQSPPVSTPYSTPVTPLSPSIQSYSTPIPSISTYHQSLTSAQSSLKTISPLARREPPRDTSTPKITNEKCSPKTLLTTEV